MHLLTPFLQEGEGEGRKARSERGRGRGKIGRGTVWPVDREANIVTCNTTGLVPQTQVLRVALPSW